MQFLEKALIPLHKPRGVATYHPQVGDSQTLEP